MPLWTLSVTAAPDKAGVTWFCLISADGCEHTRNLGRYLESNHITEDHLAYDSIFAGSHKADTTAIVRAASQWLTGHSMGAMFKSATSTDDERQPGLAFYIDGERRCARCAAAASNGVR